VVGDDYLLGTMIHRNNTTTKRLALVRVREIRGHFCSSSSSFLKLRIVNSESSIPKLLRHSSNSVAKLTDRKTRWIIMGRQERMYPVISGLGEKPTDTKANLPTLKMPHIDRKKELKDKVELLTIIIMIKRMQNQQRMRFTKSKKISL
jgi:hypothetical protein